MKNGIYSATAGMLTALERLNVISNNIANINTAGYKTDMPFEQVIKFLSEEPYPGKDQPVLAGTMLDLGNGSIKITGRSLDMAFEGKGFFVVQGPQGTPLYTRNGAFTLTAKRELVTVDGLPVLNKFNKKIQLVGDNFSITPNGDIFVDGSYFTSIQTADFAGRQDVEKIGNHLFQKKATATAKPLDNPKLVSGALEMSNVNIMSELAEMIVLQRAFDSQARAVDSILNKALRRSVADVPRPI